MTVGKDLKVNLFASEKEFPELAKPVQMSFDTKGRLWVAVWPTYPHWKPKEEMNDKLLILEDTDGDGKADKRTVFADDLHCPTGFEFWNGGVLVAQAPDLMFLKDTDGDDKADVRERVLARPRLGRHAPHLQQLRARPGRGALFPGRDVPPHPGRDAVRPAGPLRRTPASSATSRKSQKFEVYVSLRLRQPARPRLRPLGPGHRGRRHRRRPVLTARCSRATSITRSKHGRPAAGLPAADPALPRHRVPLQPALPRGVPGQPAGRQRDRLPGHPPLQDRGQGRQPRRHRARADPVVARSELPARPTSRSGRTARSTSSTGRTRSSATCSTTSATPAATGSRPRLPGHLRRPAALEARQDRRRADRELLDLLKDPEDRVRYRARIELGAPGQRPGRRRRSRPGSRSSTRPTPIMSIT